MATGLLYTKTPSMVFNIVYTPELTKNTVWGYP